MWLKDAPIGSVWRHRSAQSDFYYKLVGWDINDLPIMQHWVEGRKEPENEGVSWEKFELAREKMYPAITITTKTYEVDEALVR
jgi:hypothetical protein